MVRRFRRFRRLLVPGRVRVLPDRAQGRGATALFGDFGTARAERWAFRPYTAQKTFVHRVRFFFFFNNNEKKFVRKVIDEVQSYFGCAVECPRDSSRLSNTIEIFIPESCAPIIICVLVIIVIILYVIIYTTRHVIVFSLYRDRM